MITATKHKFGLLITCAVRHALGRLTYMPSAVAEIVLDTLPFLDNRTLYVTEKDIEEHIGTTAYPSGFKDIETEWRRLLDAVRHERNKRGDAN